MNFINQEKKTDLDFVRRFYSSDNPIREALTVSEEIFI